MTDYATLKGNHNPWPGSHRVEPFKQSNDTLTKINTAINNDTTLSDNAKHALIELMRVAYEEVVSESRHG